MTYANQCFDERGVPIEEFDVLRVFHFVAAQRREKIYMYKQVRVVAAPGGRLLYAAHLTAAYDPAHPMKNAYHLGNAGQVLRGVRIVESPNWEKLHKRKAKAREGGK